MTNGLKQMMVSLAFAGAMLLSAALLPSEGLRQTVVFLLVAAWWVAFSFTLQPQRARAEIACLKSRLLRRRG